MTIDTSTLKTFEDAVSALCETNFLKDDAGGHAIAEWIWENCNKEDFDVVSKVYFNAAKDSELEELSNKKLKSLLL